MLKILVLLALCVECVLLLVLSISKKITKAAFIVLSSFVLLSILLLAAIYTQSLINSKDNDQKDHIYMAAKLTERGFPENALIEMGQVQDEKNEDYYSCVLRGLDYNLAGTFEASLVCLEGRDDSFSKKIMDAGDRKEKVSDELKAKILDEIYDELDYSEKKSSRLEAELELRYLISGYGTDDGSKQAEAAFAVRCGDYEEAYDTMTKAADKGSFRDVLIVSELYMRHYRSRLAEAEEEDKEFESIRGQMREALVEINRAAAERSKYALYDDKGNMLRDAAGNPLYDNSAETEYNAAVARYEMVNEESDTIAAGRAINYLSANRPIDYETNIAFQLRIANLYYVSRRKADAYEALDKVFRRNQIDKEQWLGTEVEILKKLYIYGAGDGNMNDFELVFKQMMSSLYQGVVDGADEGFIAFVERYLENLYGGIRISAIDDSAFPEIKLTISLSDEDMVLEKEGLWLRDTDKEIEDFELIEMEQDHSNLCFVLDISGSMDGKRMEDSKKAIHDSVLNIEDNTQVGLVFFDDVTEVACEMTSSVYKVSSAVEKAYARGGTNIAAGLKTAGELLSGMNGPKIIILLSDGEDGNTAGIYTVLDELNRNDIQVYTLGLQGCDEGYLEYIATSTKGRFIKVDKTERLSQIYQSIQGYLSKFYYVIYEVNDDKDDRYSWIGLKDDFPQSRKKYRSEEEAAVVPVTDEPLWEEESGKPRSDFYRENGGEEGR